MINPDAHPSAESRDVLLETASLSAAYDGREVLHSADSSFRPGEFVCILGPNGSGKSTFLTQLSGLQVPALKATQGSCCLKGKEISKYSPAERSRYITFLPQNESYAWNYSVFEAVQMGRYSHSSGLFSYSRDDDDAVRKALEMAEISHLEKRYIFELSGGEMQSVLVARALAQDTDIMILDEPFTFLDAGKSDRLMGLLRNICRKKNTCIIMSIHDINSAPRFADRIILFSQGCIIADGVPSDVFTAETMGKAYGTPFSLFTHPVYGVPQVCITPE